MIGTSARPFSVSSYSTRGGTSGKVWRATMPSSSSARRRSESVRGEMPSSERSSSQNRDAALGEVADHQQRPLAADDVGGATDGTVGVRHRTPVYRNTSRNEVTSGRRRPSRSVRCRGPRVSVSERRSAGGSSASNRSSMPRSGVPPAAAPAGRRARARRAPPGCRRPRRARAGRRARAARPRRASAARRAAARARRRAAAARPPRRGASSPTRRCSAASAGSARISPPSRRTVLRPSRRPSGSTSGPPDEPRGSGAVCSIEPATRRPRGPRKRAPGGGHEPERRAQPAPTGVGEREHRRAVPTGSPAGLPRDGRRVARLDGDDRDVEVRVRAGHAAVAASPSRERHRHLVAAQHVRVVSTRPGRDHDARAAAPAAAEPDHRRPDALGDARRPLPGVLRVPDSWLRS